MILTTSSHHWHSPIILIGWLLSGATTVSAQDAWVGYLEATDTRLVLDELYAVNDNLEKDFAWGDFDQDGWTDLVIVRKFPGSIEGGARNILLMNEGGVLVDRTDQYATTSNTPGDAGFLALTNDRDVKVADFNNDGWLDLVTATSMSDDEESIIGQPRIYMNLGADVNGDWLGFRFEDDRIPELFSKNGSAANPRFNAVDVGDLNGDGYADLFFVDHDTPETSGLVCIDLNGDGDTDDVVDGVNECNQSPGEDPAKDYDGRFLINRGAANPGYFEDTTTSRMTASQLSMGFGQECAIRDVNGDGLLDVIRVNTLTSGRDIAVLYQTEGLDWLGPFTVTSFGPYGMNAADLDNDGDIDVVSVDDGQDAYVINNGNNGSGQANWTRYTIADSLNEFGNSAQFGDLDGDGWLDMIIADVDSDLPPFCPSSGRRMYIYRNTGVTNDLFDEDGSVLPEWALQSTYDSAPIDIDNDGYLDLVIGACYGLSVWINEPPIGIDFSYPKGLPEMVAPVEPLDLAVMLEPSNGVLDETSPTLHYTIDDGPTVSIPMQGSGSNWVAPLPGFDCGDDVGIAFTARLLDGSEYRDPPLGEHAVEIISDLVVIFEDDMEAGTNGWTTNAEGTGTTGAWELADPIATIAAGLQYAPGEAASGTFCWVTQNGLVGGSAGTADVDGGPFTLTSPVFDLDGEEATVSFDWWLVNDDLDTTAEDTLLVEVTNGGPWVTARAITSNSSGWNTESFKIGDHIVPSSTVQIRFQIADVPNNSLTEAAIDDVVVERIECVQPPIDCNDNGVADRIDLGNGTSTDCNRNLVPDECDIADGAPDANLDGIPDACQGQLVFAVPARFPTVTSAIVVAPEGSRIQLAPGNYAEAIDLGTRNLQIVGDRADPASTTLETPGMNMTVVTIAGGQDASTLIAGVLIENGISSTPEPGFPANSVGGGLYIDGASPVIEDCIVGTNQATRGGGAYLRFSEAVFRRTVIEGNATGDGGGGLWWQGGVISLEDCTIRNNQAQGDGGGLHVATDGGSIAGGAITGNFATNDGAGLWWRGFLQPLDIIDVEILMNTAGANGGGVFSVSGFFGIRPSELVACDNFPNQIRGPYTIMPAVTNTVCRCGDINGDGEVNGIDLGLYLAVGGTACGEFEDCPADITFDGVITGADLGRILGDWGFCP